MLIGAILIGRAVFTETEGDSGKIDAPNMIGSTVEQAQRLADNADVLLKVGSKEPCEAQEKNQICSQSPSADAQMETGETVTVVVSTGAPKVEVPDVLEKSEDSARKKLEDEGFTVSVTSVESDATPGTVTKQDPEGGSKVEKDSEVTITVAKEATQVVPGVVGRSYADAEAQLKGVGFANVSRTDVESDQPVDTVVEQTPAPNSKQSKDTQIVLKVSKGPAQPEQVTIPGDIAGKPYKDAKATLEGLGLVVALAPNSSDKPNALVMQADPGPNSQVAKGSTVTLTTIGGTDGGNIFGGRNGADD